MDGKQKKKRKLRSVEIVDAQQDGGLRLPVKEKKKRQKEATVNER